jgi:hypothetical protein
MPNVQSRLVVQGVNDEGTPSDVDNDENAFADNKSIRVLPKERVESPLFDELTGEWTATATVWYNTYINNVLTKIDTTVVSKVVIGETTSAETTPEEVYEVYQETLGAEYSKEYVDAVNNLKKGDLIQVDFYGFCPMNNYTKTTSLFLSRDFNFKSQYIVQPINGWGNLWGMGRKHRKEFFKVNK